MFGYLWAYQKRRKAVDNPSEKALIESLLLERDELYQELSKLRELDKGALEKAEKKNAQLEKILKEKDQQLEKIVKERDQQLEKIVKEKDQLIKKLTDQLAWLRRKFWKSSSERYIPSDPLQRKIDFEGLDVLPEEQEATKQAAEEIITYKRKKPEHDKKQAVRLPLPEDLRREEVIIEPEGIDENWVRIGEEVTEILEDKPGELYVRRYIRYKYALKKELQLTREVPADKPAESNIKIAPLPLLPLPRSNAGASLLAELLMNKYMYHLPFYRQIEMYKLQGVKIAASTINDWFAGCSDLLRALYDRLKELVLESDYIQVDESTVPVIDHEKKRTVKSYLWVVRAVMKDLIFFHYDKGSRKQKVVIELLRNFLGLCRLTGMMRTQFMSIKRECCC